MKVDIYSVAKERVGEISLSPSIFGCERRLDILHEVVTWQLAKRRLGTHQTKEVDAINASTRKIYAQKGTGRARHGSVKAPQFRGGATIFGPHVRDHGFKLNKKVRKLGLKIALSSKLSLAEFFVLDGFNVESGKTKDLVKILSNFNAKSVLIIDSHVNSEVARAASNLHKVDVLPVAGLNVYDILNHKAVLITAAAIKSIEERLQ